jgi:hypothetical protein
MLEVEDSRVIILKIVYETWKPWKKIYKLWENPLTLG